MTKTDNLRCALLSLVLSYSFFSHAQIGMDIPKSRDTVSVRTSRDTILFQQIIGQVVNSETQQPLAGANILLDTLRDAGTSSDEKGNFVFKNLAVGRHQLRISYVGYKDYVEQVLLTSTKTAILDIQLEPTTFYLAPVNVRWGMGKPETVIGTNQINADALSYHAGNRGDPVRKASVMTGSQGNDDSRNDVITRGNSPQSVLWRIEGINIPNPNHFNIPGTSGGPIPMINDKMLSNSSFYSGVFPAQYGNTTSGIFDLYFQTGDSTAYNTSVQVGMLGADVSTEGPLSSKHRSSYLFTFRRSVLGVFNALNIDIGTQWIPHYTDLSFKLNFSTGRKSSLSVFGLGGMSNIDILISQQDRPDENLYGEKDRDQYFQANMGFVGLSYKQTLGSDGYLSLTLAGSSQYIDSHHNLVYPETIRKRLLMMNSPSSSDTLPPVKIYNFQEKRISFSLLYSKRLQQNTYLQAGISGDQYFFHFRDIDRNIVERDDQFGTWRKRWWSDDQGLLLQPYAQVKYGKERINLLLGLHSQVFTLTNSVSWAEPRALIQYNLRSNTILTGAFGLHSQIQQPYLYFYAGDNEADGDPILFNSKMDFTRSIHSSIGFEKLIVRDSTRQYRIKIETYYQRLYDIPVDGDSPTAFSMINTGADFRRLAHNGTLVNSGLGKNYGIELTVEKTFSHGYLFLITASLFESKYKGSDGVWRNTDFNSEYIFNALFTREWIVQKRNVFSAGCRFTTTGGRWHGRENLDASDAEHDVVYFDEDRNTFQFDPYYRFDLRLSYRINNRKSSHEVAVDIINLFNIRNVLRETYVPGIETNKGSVVNEYQLGILPFFYYRIEF